VVKLDNVRTYILIIALGAFCYSGWELFRLAAPATIKVGILFSRTGTMAFTEAPMINITLLAIREINAQGGLLGQQIEPVIVDGRSDWQTFATQTEKLLTEDKVKAIFGCWLSSEEKAVRPLVEKYNNLLFYPAYYEGVEASAHVIYTGGAPNQLALPGPVWMMRTFGKRVFLLGTESIFPRVVYAMLKQILPQLGGEIVGEEYLLVGNEDIAQALEKIKKTKPDFIVNSIGGSVNIPFYKGLKQLSDKTGKVIPSLTYSLQSPDYPFIGLENLQGCYAISNYFDTIQNDENRRFLQKLHQTSSAFSASSQMHAAYLGVHLWAEGVRKAQSLEHAQIVKALHGISFKAAQGILNVGWTNTLLYQPAYIAQITKEGKDEIIWSAGFPIEPIPYPSTMFLASLIDIWPSAHWDSYINNLYTRWGNKWAK